MLVTRPLFTTLSKGIIGGSSAAKPPQSAPIITKQPVSQSKFPTETALFKVEANDSNMTLRYQWQHSTDGTVWSNLSGETGSTLSLTTNEGTANKTYRVVVESSTTGLRTTSAEAVLTMKANNITITKQPSDITANDDENITLSVVATVPYGGITYKWQYKNEGETGWSDSGLDTANQADLLVTASAGSSGRKYRCILTATAGGNTVTSREATLITHGAPVITSQPQNQEGYPTQQVTFRVVATEG